MKLRYFLLMLFLCVLFGSNACAEETDMNAYMRDTPIRTVAQDAVFGDYGRLIFPVDEGYMSGDTLGNLRLTWYNNIDPDKTVEIVNSMRNRVLNGETIFYDLYTEEEKAAKYHEEMIVLSPQLIQFAFFDYDEPLAFFLLDYLMVMLLFMSLGVGVQAALSQKRRA